MNQNPVQIIQGGATAFLVKLINKTTGDPMDLSTATAITCCFQKVTGPELTLSLGAGISNPTPVIGKLKISLTSAQAATLALVEAAILEISIVLGSADPIKVQIPRAYSVVASQC